MDANGRVVAVLDVGKTNLKMLVATADGEPLDIIARPNATVRSGAYLAYDLPALEGFFLDALAGMAQRHRIGAVVATAHGSGGVLVDDTGPVLPMMDYETPCPAWLDEAYAAEAPPYSEVFCPVASIAMRIAKQLMWQEAEFPEEFARARHFLTTSQYLAWRLGGRTASEISQLGAQDHLWAPLKQEPSSIVKRRGWVRLLPPLARAGEVLGTMAPALAARTGLSGTTEILCGAHDSNANLFRYKAAGMPQATVLSTGTWMIGFERGKPLASLDPRRAMVANVDVDGEPVASTLTMTGREYAILAGSAQASDAEASEAVAPLLARGTLALPSFVSDDGAFPGRARRGEIVGPKPQSAAEQKALAALYAAFYASFCLDSLGAGPDIVVDGGFAGNLAFGRLLAALRPQARVFMSRSRDGTALGAALLWKRFERRAPVTSVALDCVEPYSIPGLAEAQQRWVRLASDDVPPERA